MADYDLKMGAVDIDFGGLGPLGELADIISPQVSVIIQQKIREVMEGDVKQFLTKEIEKRIPNISSLVN